MIYSVSQLEVPRAYQVSGTLWLIDRREVRAKSDTVRLSSPRLSALEFRDSPSFVSFPEAIESKQTSGSSIVYDLEAKISYLRQLYTFRNQEEVLKFLQEHPFLVELLLEAYSHIKEHFGFRTPVFLEVVHDPEIINDSQLVAFIQTDLDPIRALEKLDRFDKDWWVEASRRGEGKLCIHLEYL